MVNFDAVSDIVDKAKDTVEDIREEIAEHLKPKTRNSIRIKETARGRFKWHLVDSGNHTITFSTASFRHRDQALTDAVRLYDGLRDGSVTVFVESSENQGHYVWKARENRAWHIFCFGASRKALERDAEVEKEKFSYLILEDATLHEESERRKRVRTSTMPDSE